MTISLIVAALVMLVTFALGPLRQWLEARATAIAGQSDLVDIYQANVAKFIRHTSMESHPGLRGMLLWAGKKMTGTTLVDLIAKSERDHPIQESGDDPALAALEAEFESLPEDLVHTLARAMGAALCVSAKQSRLHRERYQGTLNWVLSKSDGEVKEPKQVVYRYSKAVKSAQGALRAGHEKSVA